MGDYSDTEGFYVTISTDYTFLVKVKKESDFIDDIIFIVSISPVPKIQADIKPSHDDHTCLNITVTIGDENMAHLGGINHDRICTVSPNLPPKHGTYQMLMSTLNLCHQLFGVTKFTLHDTAVFFCTPDEKIFLRPYNMLIHGKSWYERKFGAYPKDPQERTSWERAKQTLNPIVDKSRADQIIKRIQEDTTMGFGRGRFNYLKEIIMDSVDVKSWVEMFSTINDIESIGCKFFLQRNLRRYLSILDIPNPEDWVIELKPWRIGRDLVAYTKL